jgi:excinuclease UvrABC nuclease subunit
MTHPAKLLWTPDSGTLDGWLDGVPQSPAVFVISAREGAPYLGRTSMLGRRLRRLLGERPQPSRLLNLRAIAERVEVWLTASWLENALISLELARRHFPGDYARVLRLPRPPYVKLLVSNRFPRTQITTRLGGRSRYFGPFRNRAEAENFEKSLLDLFQVRRCQEDLIPSPDHPGCIYGEMQMCLRPCQQAVSDEEYSSEVVRLQDFLLTAGESLARPARAARDRLSGELRFEEAAREHARLERIAGVQKLSGDLARSVDELHGVAVTAGHHKPGVRLWFLAGGVWRAPHDFSLAPDASGKPVSFDARLREIASALKGATAPAGRRQEHLAVLVRWYFSSSRDGEWLPMEAPDAPPYRKLVNAIHRVSMA